MELDKTVLDAYKALSEAHAKYLSAHGVKLPLLYYRGQPTATALTLCYLYMNLGKPVTKTALTEFVHQYRKTNDLQAGRHLANGSGWKVLATRRRDARTREWPKDSYALTSVTEPYDGFKRARTGALTAEAWKTLLAEAEKRCKTCGSTEGQANFRKPAVKTELQQGHIDPHKPLTIENCIPQCQICNQPARNTWVWGKDGQPFAVADANVVLRSSPEVQKEMFELLRDTLDEQSK